MRVRKPAIWIAYLLGIPMLAVVLFAIPETLAMRDAEGLTLSQFTYTLFSHNLLLLAVVSFNAGGLLYGLLVHFFWHWIPNEMKATCGQCGKTILIGADR